jgi:hypothetical protein
MLEPHTTITDAISTFRNALKCHSCERCPGIEAERFASSSSDSSNTFYHGPLLAAIECGCMFCQDCYAAASICINTPIQKRDAILRNRCPICQTICKQAPRPLLPWLANENKALPTTLGKFGNAENESLEQLNAFLETICPSIDTSKCKSDEASDTHSHDEESEVPVTCLPLRPEPQKLPIYFVGSEIQDVMEINQPESSHSFPQTEEVPGTCLSYIDKQRMAANRNPQYNSQLDQDDTLGLQNSAAGTEEIHGTTGEVHASHLSNFERQRIPNNRVVASDVESVGVTAPYNETCNMHSEEVPGTLISFLDRQRMHTKDNITSNQPIDSEGDSVWNVEEGGETEEVPGTLISFNLHQKQQDDLSVPCNEACGDQSEEVSGTYASNSQTKHPREKSGPENETEEVAGTHISSFNRQRTSMRISESQSKCISLPLKAIEKEPQIVPYEATAGAEILGKPCTINKADRTFYLAIGNLISAEADALQVLNKQGHCAVVNGIHRHDKSAPFPPFLVTHAVEKTSSEMLCLRSYQYLKAVALGAQVINAKWLLDSKQAGALLDYGPYIICNRPLQAKPRLLEGLSFGIIDIGVASSYKIQHTETNSSSSYMKSQPRSMTYYSHQQVSFSTNTIL